MSEVPPSPAARRLAAPRWLDARLVVGVLLVLVSVLVGARVLAGADRSQLVWATDRELAPGTVLTAEHLVPLRVRLFDSAGLYLDAAQPAPVGYVTSRGLGRGELLPDDALRRPGADVDYRLVTVPVELGHVPPTLADAQQVDVWVTPSREQQQSSAAAAPVESDPTSGQPTAAGRLAGAQLVLEAVTVTAAPELSASSGGGTSLPVVLQVRPKDVAALLSAMSSGRIDLVRVPRSAEVPPAPGVPAASG